MMALTAAGIIFGATLFWCGLIMFANGMSDNPTAHYAVLPWLFGGLILATLVASLHWSP